MGLRSPQEMQQVQASPERSTRLQGSAAPQIGTQFLNTLDAVVDSKEKDRQRQEESDYKFQKDVLQVELDRKNLEAQARLVSMKGPAVLKEANKLRQEVMTYTEKTISNANPKYRERFYQDLAPGQLNKFDRNSIPYQYAQVREFKETVYKDRIAQLSNDVVESSTNPEFLGQTAIPNLYDKVLDYVKSQYGEDLSAEVEPGVTVREYAKTLGAKAASQSLSSSVGFQASAGGITKAEEIYNRYEFEMLPADRQKALKALEKAKADATNGIAMELANTAMAEYGEDINAISRALNAGSGGNKKLFDDSMSVVMTTLNAQKRTRELRRQKVNAEVIQSIDQGQPLSANMLNAIDPEDRAKMQKYAVDVNRNRFTTTNPQVYRRLMDTLANDPDKFLNGEIDLMAYKADLNEADYKIAESWVRQLSKDQNKENLRVANRGVRVAGDVVARFKSENRTKLMELFPEQTPEESGAIVDRIAYEYANELQELNPKIGEKELRNKVNQALYERALVKKPEEPGFFRRIGEAIGVADPADRPVSEAIQRPAVQVVKPVRDEIIKQYGSNLTETQIRDYAQRLKKQYPKLNVFE